MYIGANGHQIDVQSNYFNPKAFVRVFFFIFSILYAYSKILANTVIDNGTQQIQNIPGLLSIVYSFENKMRFFIYFLKIDFIFQISFILFRTHSKHLDYK